MSEAYQDPWTLRRAVDEVRDYAGQLQRAASAVEATEGEREQLLRLLTRVEAMGSVVWAIENHQTSVRDEEFRDAWAELHGDLFFLPILELALRTVVPDPARPVIKEGEEGWQWCRYGADDVAGRLLAWSARYERFLKDMAEVAHV